MKAHSMLVRRTAMVVSVGTLGAAAMLMAASIGGVATGRTDTAVASSSPLEGHALTPAPDVELLVRRAGLTPEIVAAAGLSSSDCDRLFTAALAYSLGVDRVAEFEIATRNANAASDNATLPIERQRRNTDGTPFPTVAQARATLSDLRSQALTAITANLPADRVLVVRRMAADLGVWNLPVKYLAAQRTDEQRLALRNALNTAALAAKRGQPVNAAAAAVIAAEDRDPDVQAAAANLASGLPLIRQAWNTRATTTSVP